MIAKVTRHVVVSDIHFPEHNKAAWKAFKEWIKLNKPDHLVVLGDFLDLSALSRFEKSSKDSPYVAPEIKLFIKEVNELSKYTKKLSLVEGNHESRFNKKIAEALGHAADGLVGLSLKDQLFAQGLVKTAQYHVESTKFRGLNLGPVLARHGDKQASRNGGKHVAATNLARTMGQSIIVGHHHRAQFHCQTSYNKTCFGIANPCMTNNHEYCVDPDWQLGFTILEVYGDKEQFCTPHVILIQDGVFSWNGKVYNGNK